MKHNTTAIGRPSRAPQTLLALLGLGLTASVAVAATTPPSIRADGSCSASASASIVNMNDGTTTNSGSSSPCSETWSNSAIKQTTSGSATARTNLSIASAGYSASAEFGLLSVSANGSARAMSGGSYPASAGASGSSGATASFSDALTFDATSVGSTASFQVLVRGTSTVSGYTQAEGLPFVYGPRKASASFDVLLNGTSIYSHTNRGYPLYPDVRAETIGYVFTAYASDTIELIGKTISSGSGYASAYGFRPYSEGESGKAALSITIDTLYTPGQLIAASGHNYASAISPVPEPSTWALMAVGLLGIGASSVRRRQAAALNAD